MNQLHTDGLETNVTAEIANEPVTHVTSGLTNGTKYNFTLFTVSENVRSSGVSISAFTAPPNAEDFKSVGQNETSVTLQWKKVENILTYVLVSSDGLETNVTAEIANEPVTHVTSGLTNGTRYNFTLFTVSENVRSSGVSISSFTAPPNAEDFKSVGQNETSVTLQWKKVENILTYVLVSSDGLDTNVTAVMGNEPVRHVTSGLTNGTRYNFTLFTVSANVRSSGVSISAFTAPANAEDFKSVGQNETSITLQWKKVENILTYVLVSSDGLETNVTAEIANEPVTHVTSGLTNGTRYNFTLFTVSENVRSSGVSISSFTAPPNAEDFKSVGQNETSVTLQWKKVENILTYVLVSSDGLETNVTAEIANEPVTHVTSGLTNGTKYNFTLFTVSENVRSSGVSISAFTAPRNAEDFKSVGQNETSVTLQWKKVENILTYVLVSSDGLETNVTAEIANEPVTHVTSGLTNGTRYNFTLFTVSENVRSSGVSISSFTAPPNAEDFKSVGQNETSVTLQWKKVENILTYVLVSSDGLDTNVTAEIANEPVRHVTSGLTNGSKYNFTLFTVFAKVRSSGVSISAFTAPPNAEEFKSVGQNETSVTLQWKKVENILTYVLVSSDGLDTNVTAVMGNEPVRHVTSGLTNGTRYNFTLFTVSANVRSSGVSISA
ncbi:receptor-type tyrosine-protein phosphatase H-like, partial [Platichthys flesus]|uniref:receptor-type tyrosine-protein phosphatase H-like n=1 Tax=Platichthys flesus TaxID=8260 RepID=UPI002DBB1576